VLEVLEVQVQAQVQAQGLEVQVEVAVLEGQALEVLEVEGQGQGSVLLPPPLPLLPPVPPVPPPPLQQPVPPPPLQQPQLPLQQPPLPQLRQLPPLLPRVPAQPVSVAGPVWRHAHTKMRMPARQRWPCPRPGVGLSGTVAGPARRPPVSRSPGAAPCDCRRPFWSLGSQPPFASPSELHAAGALK
jgi:hypothetical protein